MAYTVKVKRGATTYVVSDGTYSQLVAMQGIGAPTKRNISIRGPFQHGETITDFRYETRTISLVFFFDKLALATSDANRDSLYSIWKGVQGEPVKVEITRDDSTVLQIDGEVTGVLDMAHNLQERIGTSQRFAVQIECGDPMFYSPTQDSVSFTSADNVAWYLALGTIDAGEVEEQVTTPTQGQSVDNGVAIADSNPWTVYFRTDVTDLTPASFETAVIGSNGSSTAYYAFLSSTLNRISSAAGTVNGIFDTGQNDYFLINDGVDLLVYRNTTLVGTISSSPYGVDGTNVDTAWRSNGSSTEDWTPDLNNAAIYNIALSPSQRAALINALNASIFDISKTIAYGGSWRAYPIITIEGPITDPVLINTGTGEKLDFTGVTISGGDTYTIDCRYGFKTVKNAAGTNKIADLTSDSDLATFHLAPDPEVSSGNNAFTLTGTATDANTKVTVAYNEQFVGL